MPDQIYTAGPLPAPLVYNVPGSQRMIPRACQAVFNGSGASGDYVPALIFRSQAGHVIARAILTDTVTAGDDAEVSWFPGVKTGAPPALLQSRSAHSYAGSAQVIPSGVSTPITFDSGTIYSPTSLPLHGVDHGTFFDTFTVAVFRVGITLDVTWTVGNYDRYIEISDPSFFTSGAPVNYRVRDSITPNGDNQTVTALIDGSPVAPKALGLNAFQASGVNKLIFRWLTVYQWPEIVGQGGWPG